MHELSLATGLLDTLEGLRVEHGGHPVLSATVEVGELSCIVPDALTFAFEAVSKGTALEGCELVIVPLPLQVRCRGCGAEGEASLEDPACPACGERGLEVIGGRELRLRSMEVDDGTDGEDRLGEGPA